MNKKRGFTLVEIMIVVAIIALLAAIAIPSLLNARRTANDAAARSNIRTLATEEETWSAGAGDGEYFVDVAAFKVASAGATKYCGVSSGGFTYACVTAKTGYTVTATCNSEKTGTKTWTATTGGMFTEVACP